VVVNGLGEAIANGLDEAVPDFFVARNIGGGQPEPGEQIDIVANTDEQGVLAGERVGEVVAHQVGQLATGEGGFPGDGINVEAFAKGGGEVGHPNALEGVDVLGEFLGERAQNDSRPALLVTVFVTAIHGQGQQGAHKNADEGGNGFGDEEFPDGCTCHAKSITCGGAWACEVGHRGDLRPDERKLRGKKTLGSGIISQG